MDVAPPGAIPILFQDEQLIVVDKPAGLATHRGWAPEKDVLVARLREQLGRPVFAVHRLDRGTSGALALALSSDSARALGLALAAGQVEKTYWALVRGIPAESGVIDHPVPTDEDRHSARVPAQTAFTRLEVFGRYALVEARPLTGRLHQIRRHFKHISCPLIGDVRYGKGEHNRLFRERFGLHRLFLHAAKLRLPHPVSGQPISVEAPLPLALAQVLEGLRASPLISSADTSGPRGETVPDR